MENNDGIDISQIIVIPSDTEIPVHNNSILTKRPLCTNFPENSTILDRTEAIKIITDISEDLNKSEETCIRNLPIYVEELQAVFDPLKVTECDSDLFKEGKYTTCDNLDELKKLLSELLIKFDTNPEYYIKEDYLYLISVLYKSLIHLYEASVGSVITTEWNDPLRDNWVPSEKLTKETIDAESERIEGLISDETSARQSADSDLQDNIDSEAGIRASEITRIEGLISDEAVTRQQADTNLQNTKLDNLTAGSNISITNNIISAVDTIYDDTEVRGLISQVDLKVDSLDEFECGTIVPTTTNFVEGTDYTIHEALQRTANLFEGHQEEIDDINDLIPNQATEQNKLADKAFVNSTVATNAANFRGNWAIWENVPANASYYPEDYVGNRTPTNNDYLVVQDAGDYINPEILSHQLTVVNLHATKPYTIGVTDEFGAYNEYYYNDGFNSTWKSISSEYSLIYYGGAPGLWYIKTNKPEDTRIVINNVVYENANNGIFLINTSYTTPVVAGLPAEVGQYQGSWRFIYVGTWATNGKLGWNPQYRIGSAFTAELLAAIDSGITSSKVSTYDGYATSIGALQTDKVDKIYTASKVYGTDSQGSQIGYTAGDGISFTNGLIVNTRTSAAWGNITGTLSNQTDLLVELDSCVTSEEVQSVGDVTAYVNSQIPVIDKTSDSSSSFAIDANKMYMFGTRSSLTITLNPGESGIVNEYMFLFTSGSVATTLNVPSSVTWLKDPDIQTNKRYTVSIENNLGVIGEWSNE